jgi:hypothetical protein
MLLAIQGTQFLLLLLSVVEGSRGQRIASRGCHYCMACQAPALRMDYPCQVLASMHTVAHTAAAADTSGPALLLLLLLAGCQGADTALHSRRCCS